MLLSLSSPWSFVKEHLAYPNVDLERDGRDVIKILKVVIIN